MELVPLFGEERITASNVTIQVSGTDRERALRLVQLAGEVPAVIDEDSFNEARQVAAQLKAMLDEIEYSRMSAKVPFTAIGRALDQAASDVSTPVQTAQKRILGLLNAYVAGLEIARKAEQRREADARRIAQEEADRKVREAQAELQAAKDEIARTKAENQLLQQQLAAELAEDIEDLGKPSEAPRGLVPGGRVDHLYEFTLVDVAATIKAGCWRLVKWTLDIRACQDAVKNLIECAPNVEPELPGIKITKRLNVSVKAASRIR